MLEEDVEAVDGVVANSVHLVISLTSSSKSLPALVWKLVGDSSLENGTLFPLVRLIGRLLLPANLQLGDDNSFLCSAVVFARHFVGLIALTLGETIVLWDMGKEFPKFAHGSSAKSSSGGSPGC